jgi:hypothetical protein
MVWSLGRSAALLVLASVFLGGCAQLPRQAFNPQAAAHVKTVVVAQTENQTEYPAQILGHPGMSFGLIGGLVAAADMHAKSTKLTAAIDPKETRVQERFAERLREKLRQAGYETVVIMVPKVANQDEALAQAKLKAKGDAVIAVDLYAGYWAAGPSSDYFPRMEAKVKTVDVQSSKVLYQDVISYGYTMPQAQTIHLASDPGYRFGTIDLLVADPAKTRQGLYAGIDALAEQIANDLKK